MTQLVTRVPDPLVAAVDELIACGEIESRSAAVRTGLLRLVEEHRRRATGEAIVAGYRRVPQAEAEIGWPDRATTDMIAAEPW